MEAGVVVLQTVSYVLLIQRSHLLEVLFDLLIRRRVVLNVSVEIPVIGGHVDETVTREVEQEHLALALDLALLCLLNSGGYGVAGLRSGDDALGA